MFHNGTDKQEQHGDKQVSWNDGFVLSPVIPLTGLYNKLFHSDEYCESWLVAINANSIVQRNHNSKSSGEQPFWDDLEEDLHAIFQKNTSRRSVR